MQGLDGVLGAHVGVVDELAEDLQVVPHGHPSRHRAAGGAAQDHQRVEVAGVLDRRPAGLVANGGVLVVGVGEVDVGAAGVDGPGHIQLGARRAGADAHVAVAGHQRDVVVGVVGGADLQRGGLAHPRVVADPGAVATTTTGVGREQDAALGAVAGADHQRAVADLELGARIGRAHADVALAVEHEVGVVPRLADEVHPVAVDMDGPVAVVGVDEVDLRGVALDLQLAAELHARFRVGRHTVVGHQPQRAVDLQLRTRRHRAHAHLAGGLVDEQPRVAVAVGDAQAGPAGLGIARVAARAERQAEGRLGVVEVAVEVQQLLLAAVVAVGLQAQWLAGRLGEAVVALVQRGADQLLEVAGRGHGVLDEVGLQRLAAGLVDLHGGAPGVGSAGQEMEKSSSMRMLPMPSKPCTRWSLAAITSNSCCSAATSTASARWGVML